MPSTADAPALPPARKSPRAWGLLLAVTIAAGGVDLLSKYAVFDGMLASEQNVAKFRETADVLAALDRPELPDTDTPAFTRLVLQQTHVSQPALPGVDLTLSTNPGVVFGITALPRWAVNLVTVGMILAITGIFAASPARSHWLHVALGLILGGAFGNLYDRLFSSVALPVAGLAPIRYHVRDFVDCSAIGYPYIFNLADAWLVVGVGMVMLQWVREAIHRPAESSRENR